MIFETPMPKIDRMARHGGHDLCQAAESTSEKMGRLMQVSNDDGKRRNAQHPVGHRTAQPKCRDELHDGFVDASRARLCSFSSPDKPDCSRRK